MDEREAAIAEEERRVRELRLVVDVTASLLRQGRFDRAEAEALVAATRQHVLGLFPDKGSVYELVLAPRFRRLIDEFARPRGRVLPFHSRP